MKRAKHSLNHYRLATMNQGELMPVACMEVLPGDSFRHACSMLMRVSPLVAPVMHPVHVSIHHWFCPNRLVWGNWETFIANTTAMTPIPTVEARANVNIVRLANAFGIGVDTSGPAINVNALPFRAYNLIFNEFYRDQDLVTPLPVSLGDGPDNVANYGVQRVAWEKDYYTLCRPYPQQGSSSQVALLTGEAKLKNFWSPTSPVPSGPYTVIPGTTTSGSPGAARVLVGDVATTESTPKVDLSGASVSMDINEWRRAMAYQRISEHRSRYGSRYRDYLAFLGVRASDARLQRPEYLGGGKQTVSFSEVLATTESTTPAQPLGDMGGHGIAALRTRTYRRFFEEHGWVISLAYVRPKTVYQNAVPRKFLRKQWSDFWQKELEMMGEQPVGNQEVYAASSTPTGVFGYMMRHDDYRHHESTVSGEFRNTLNYWHMARVFASQPALNSTFVTADPTNRIYASASTDQLYCMIAHQVSARRLVSKVARTG